MAKDGNPLKIWDTSFYSSTQCSFPKAGSVIWEAQHKIKVWVPRWVGKLSCLPTGLSSQPTAEMTPKGFKLSLDMLSAWMGVESEPDHSLVFCHLKRETAAALPQPDTLEVLPDLTPCTCPDPQWRHRIATEWACPSPTLPGHWARRGQHQPPIGGRVREAGQDPKPVVPGPGARS